MLLTITTTHRPATDLGYLLHKHPDRVQEFGQSFGTATVFYPVASEERCTAAVMLEVDPVRLARSRRKGSSDVSLSQYVNDRSYAASSLLGAAVAEIFSTARAGRCKSRQELADSAIPLEIEIPVLPSHGGPDLVQRLFAPLGWTVETDSIPLDETLADLPGWGDSRYVRLRLTGTVRLADALTQIYVLLPVLDESKHYWQGDDEVGKLLRAGESWLPAHPESELITRRYLARTGLARTALDRLAELGGDTDEAAPAEEEHALQPESRRTPLNRQRHDAVLAALLELDARSVIDLGCGPGAFLARLVETPSFARVAGAEVSTRALQQAARRLHVDTMSERLAARLELFQSALTYEDERLAGYDAAVLMEVVEHVDPERLDALVRVVFGAARPGAVLVTTPNREYNDLYVHLDGMRHPDHRFEWTRVEFAAWCAQVADAHGYAVTHRGIGDVDTERGTPTQLAIFTRVERTKAAS